MEILFVCRANVGRSQMAEAVFNKSLGRDAAVSAGLEPGKWEGRRLSESRNVSSCMKEIGINVDDKISKKITRELVDKADKIIVIGERENWPDYLKKSGKVSYWHVDDPALKDRVFNRKTRNKIAELVKDLLIEAGG